MRSTEWTATPGHASAAPATKAKGPAPKAKLGSLPEWNLTDLYPSVDAPRLHADLKRPTWTSHRRYCGKLAKVADGGKGAALADAVRVRSLKRHHDFIVSIRACLSADTADNGKFFGDIRRLHDLLQLLFFRSS
jgi:oligoendopeptidase F